MKLGFWLSLTLLGETEQEQSWEQREGSELHSVPVSSTGQQVIEYMDLEPKSGGKNLEVISPVSSLRLDERSVEKT